MEQKNEKDKLITFIKQLIKHKNRGGKIVYMWLFRSFLGWLAMFLFAIICPPIVIFYLFYKFKCKFPGEYFKIPTTTKSKLINIVYSNLKNKYYYKNGFRILIWPFVLSLPLYLNLLFNFSKKFKVISIQYLVIILFVFAILISIKDVLASSFFYYSKKFLDEKEHTCPICGGYMFIKENINQFAGEDLQGFPIREVNLFYKCKDCGHSDEWSYTYS